MKKFLFVALMFIVASITIPAQTLKFQVVESTVINQATNQSYSEATNFKINITDYYLKFVENELIWTFTSQTIKTSEVQFYVWAKDSYDITCKVWFNATSKNTANIGIEYSDFAFVYKTYRLN